MGFVLVILSLLTAVAVLVGWIWITCIAFSEGEILWGLGCLIISPVCVIFGLLNFDELKVPLFLFVGGFIGQICVGVLAGLLS